MSAAPVANPATSASFNAATMLPSSNLDCDAWQDRLDLLWTFVPVTVALGAMTIWLAWSSLEDASFASVQATALVAPMPSASAALPAVQVERLRAAAPEPTIVKVDGDAPAH